MLFIIRYNVVQEKLLTNSSILRVCSIVVTLVSQFINSTFHCSFVFRVFHLSFLFFIIKLNCKNNCILDLCCMSRILWINLRKKKWKRSTKFSKISNFPFSCYIFFVVQLFFLFLLKISIINKGLKFKI